MKNVSDRKLMAEAELLEKFTSDKKFICNVGIIKDVAVAGIKGRFLQVNDYLPRGDPICKFLDSHYGSCKNNDWKSCPYVIRNISYYSIDERGEVRRL